MENNFNTLIETFFNNRNDITTRGKALMELSDFIEKEEDYEKYIRTFSVSYTHLTLPTKLEV